MMKGPSVTKIATGIQDHIIILRESNDGWVSSQKAIELIWFTIRSERLICCTSQDTLLFAWMISSLEYRGAMVSPSTPGNNGEARSNNVSTSSMETAGSSFLKEVPSDTTSLQLDASNAPVNFSFSSTAFNADNHGTMEEQSHFNEYNPAIPTLSAMPSSTLSLAPRPPHAQIPSTGVTVTSPAANTANTIPEFLYQLTKMLTDNNREIIEWSDGKFVPLYACHQHRSMPLF